MHTKEVMSGMGARGGGPSAPLQSLGYRGSGDHRSDLEEFVNKNCLDNRTRDALENLSEMEQKKVMGTDGGQNSFVLIDRVTNPNAVVMSRIRSVQR